MTEELIIAGSGGQGAMSLGKIIAYSGIKHGNEVSWLPAYTPEMRGGKANVTVIVSDNLISSPKLSEYGSAILLNQYGIDEFSDAVKSGGLLIHDSNVVNPPTRTDITIISIDGTKEALKLGIRQVANMILLGVFLHFKPIFSLEHLEKGLQESLSARAQKHIPINIEAVKRGQELARKV